MLLHVNTTPTFIEAHPLIINVACSIVGSLIFLFIVLIFLKPKIRISPFVCKSPSPFPTEQAEIAYYIKVVNMSLFTAYDLKAELHILERYATPPKGMMNVRQVPLTLVAGNLSNLDGYRPFWWRKEAEHCIRFRTLDNLDDILKADTKSVEFKVILRHGLTGLSKVYSQEYADLTEIKVGKFSYGTKFGLLN